MGGLLSSILLAKNGQKVLLLEQHHVPGGYCTSYRRKGFTFNIPSIMSGISEGELYSSLSSLGIFDELEWIELDNLVKCIYPDLEIVLPANDLLACRRNLAAAFPSEKSAIDKFFLNLSKFQDEFFVSQQQGSSIKNIVASIKTIPKLIYLSKKSYYAYVRKFTDNERLISVLSGLWVFTGLPSKRAPAMLLLMLFGECFGRPIYFPRNGYQAISDFLAKKFSDFGGEIKYRTKALRILVKDKTAIGVEISPDEQYQADFIISNADTKKTFLELVGRHNLSEKFASKIDAHTPSASGLSLHVGTSLDLSKFELQYGSVFCNESWEDSNILYEKAVANLIDIEKDKISFSLQASSVLSDRLAPEGMYALHILLFPVSRKYRNNFGVVDGKRGEEYRKTKDQLTDILIKKTEKIIPGLSDAIVVKELATPYTFERYTDATAGAWYDGVFSIDQKFQRPSSKTPIKNLYVTGTKALGGAGMPAALGGAMQTAKTILKEAGA